MKGDTLEFNAGAFKMDHNAVVEDLLRKLPGVTIWGDGTITVNGKEVQRVLVDGKPFFGGDARIATQNLPKDAVDKIQVYKSHQEQNTPADSAMNINIKLRKDWKKGLFGKVGGGYGTNNRYTADGMVSAFAPRTQLSIAGASNNTNTIASNISNLMFNSSFKGVGVNTDYQPDFGMQGSHRSNSGGLYLEHDFIPDVSVKKNNNLLVNYFAGDQKSETDKNTTTTVRLDRDSSLTQKNNSVYNSTSDNQHLAANYNLKDDKTEFFASHDLVWNRNHIYSRSDVMSENSFQGLQSDSRFLNDEHIETKNLSFKTGLTSKPKNLKIEYAFLVNSTRNRQLSQTDFESPLNAAQNRLFDRSYDNIGRNTTHDLSIIWDHLGNVIFGRKNGHKIDVAFLNILHIDKTNTNNSVNDLDAATQKYLPDNYLTNISQYSILNEMPGLRLSRTVNRTFVNRYDRTLYLSFEAKDQYCRQENTSEHTFQDFERSYNKFLPDAEISYISTIPDHATTYKLNYNTSVDYPTVNQIAPLVDSANIYFLSLGNENIKPSYRQELTLMFKYLSFRSVNTATYTLTLSAGSIDHGMADSTLYDDLGRAVSYSVNVNGRRYWSAQGKYEKVFKFNTTQLQITGTTTINDNINPYFINNTSILSNSFASYNNVSVLYTVMDFLALKFDENVSLYGSGQTGYANNNFRNSVQKSMLTASFNCLKRVTLSSNIAFNKNTSSYSGASSFTIWNTSAIYRFLPGNRGEVKFSAFDLLHQNTSIINYGNINSLTIGKVNVLEQYFMLTVAYFPRRFGKK
jgi:hypothetical protein